MAVSACRRCTTWQAMGRKVVTKAGSTSLGQPRRARGQPCARALRSTSGADTLASWTAHCTTWVACGSGSARSRSRLTSLCFITVGRRACAGPCSRPSRCSASARRRSGGRRSAFPERSTLPATTSGGSPPWSDWWSITGRSRRESSTHASPESSRRFAATRGRARFARALARRSFVLW